jgi:hypothetical protein
MIKDVYLMFPLVHYFVNSQIDDTVSPLMALGGLFPDIAAAAGMNRDAAHTMGGPFHAWCRINAPEGLPLARGIISHGIDPAGVDYYSDEYWPGYRKGWCFMQGEKYMDAVAKTTRLPEHLVWWKSHNFIEMGCEVITDRDHPNIKDELLAVLNNTSAIHTAAAHLAAYTGLKMESIVAAFAKVPAIFAIQEFSAEGLATKQNAAFTIRHHIADADPLAMADLIRQISREIEPLYYPFFTEVIAKTRRVLSGY